MFYLNYHITICFPLIRKCQDVSLIMTNKLFYILFHILCIIFINHSFQFANIFMIENNIIRNVIFYVENLLFVNVSTMQWRYR